MPSTVIRDFRYLPREEVLEVTFLSGRRYRYFRVPLHAYEAMLRSFSKGEYFNKHVRDQFSFEAVDGSSPVRA